MTAPAAPRQSPWPRDAISAGAIALTLASFVALFAEPIGGMARAWWSDPEAGHGLLLAPLACWLAYRQGLLPGAEESGQPVIGSLLLASGVLVRVVAALAAEAFGGRVALLLGIIGLIVFAWGTRQVLAWWLPTVVFALSVPLPEIVVGSLALPLQFQASKLGAMLLELRGVPVRLDGNVIRLPGRELFVTEACSGLRSLTALLSLGVLLGGLWLRRPWARITLVLLSLPIAVAINGVRVFLTGFLALFVSPRLAEGFTHLTEGWLMFIVAFVLLGGTAWLLSRVEARTGATRRGSGPPPPESPVLATPHSTDA